MTELNLDELFQVWAADKVARDLGLSFTWGKNEFGLEIGLRSKPKYKKGTASAEDLVQNNDK